MHSGSTNSPRARHLSASYLMGRVELGIAYAHSYELRDSLTSGQEFHDFVNTLFDGNLVR